MPEATPPRVTIGLPVFNAESSIAGAIESLLAQSHTAIRLIISDNASTDGTGEICRHFAASDNRIEYHRQDCNIGAEANFECVLQAADTEYFLWAAADDVRSHDYVELCLAFLDSHPDYVAATCPTRYVDPALAQWDMGDRSLESDDLYTNIIDFFPTTPQWHANGHVYSMFRLSVLRASMQGITHFLGSDWAIVVQALAHGKFHRFDQGHVLLGAHGTSRRLDFFRRYRTRPIHWLVPFLEFSGIVCGISRHAPLATKLRIWRKLLAVNMQGTIKHIKYERRIHKQRRETP